MKTTNTPKERPILFSGPMVRAILEGRKTQTRRLFKDKVSADCVEIHWNEASQQWRQMFYADKKDNIYPKQWWHKCPYGQPRDLLWVKETFTVGEGVIYRADWPEDVQLDGLWKSPLFMPRKASRITLEITAIRVERLQGITEDDAIAEGIYFDHHFDGYVSDDEGRNYNGNSAVRSYEHLWHSINGPDSWSANPFVWVIEFRRVQP